MAVLIGCWVNRESQRHGTLTPGTTASYARVGVSEGFRKFTICPKINEIMLVFSSTNVWDHVW